MQYGIADEEDAAHDRVPQVRGRDDGVQQDPVGASRSLERPDETSGVNLTNILRTAFSYKRVLLSFSIITVWLCNFLAKEYRQKSCS